MRNIFIVVLFISCFLILSCSSRRNTANKNSKEAFTPFREKMDKSLHIGSWNYPRYNGQVITETINNYSVFHYKCDTINYEIRLSKSYCPEFIPLFEKGILHPGLIKGCWKENTMYIGQLKEIFSAPRKRRYQFWSSCEYQMNPCEYTIELFNEEGTESLSTPDFIKNATVVYVSLCSVII